MVINLESIILAAGYCSRFDFKDSSFKKYMLPMERSTILNYIIIAMQQAKIKTIDYYRNKPESYAVVYGTDLAQEYLNDLIELFKQ